MTDGYHQTTFVLSHQYEIFYADNSLITSEIMVILWQNQGYWSVASHQNIVGYAVWLFPYGSMENPNAAKRCPNWKSTKYIFILLPHPLTPWHKNPKQVLGVKSSATYGIIFGRVRIIIIQEWMAIERRMTPVVRSRRCLLSRTTKTQRSENHSFTEIWESKRVAGHRTNTTHMV